SHPRVHGMGDREPCRWPEPARRVAGDWIRLRYRLLPYVLAAPLFEPGGRRRAYPPAGTWTDWWTRERVSGPGWVEAEHGLDTMPLWLREGAVVPMGPVVRWVGERPTDPLAVVVAPFQEPGRPSSRCRWTAGT
ncbi:MAG TPA: TIM-barrel domain-containing protein, partial [Actinomycetota bacterium]|nr:TIM-barrel domain-containing protein [Actinomycetota bacterium]